MSLQKILQKTTLTQAEMDATLAAAGRVLHGAIAADDQSAAGSI